MTIDERLDRLTERHEALSVTVELLAGDLRDLAGTVHELTEDTLRMRGIMDDLMRGYGAIAELIRRHETRLDRLEGLS